MNTVPDKCPFCESQIMVHVGNLLVSEDGAFATYKCKTLQDIMWSDDQWKRTGQSDGCRKREVQLLTKRLDEARERIKRLEEAGVWQPIETAPTDMTWVIGYDAKDGEVGTIIFDLTGDVDDEDVHYEWTDGMRTWNPTHWMPLPEPPEAKEDKP